MRNSKRPCKKDRVYDAILAQLDSMKAELQRSELMEEEQGSQGNSGGAGDSNPGGPYHSAHQVASSAPLPPNTRRLPPIFAESWHNTSAIRKVCSGINDTLERLNADFAHSGGGAGGSRGGLYGSPDGLNSLSLQQLAKRGTPLRVLSHTARQSLQRNAGQHLQDEVKDMQLREEICRVRVMAADEGVSDEQSVSDYAEEPVLPRLTPESRLCDEVAAMEESLQKISKGVSEMANIEERETGNSWWDSAMITREMKAHTIRVNYHARCVIKWNQRAREHFLSLAVSTNEQSAKCLADLLYLREQQQHMRRRIEQSHVVQADLAAEMATLQEALREGNLLKSKLQQKLVDKAHEQDLLPPDCNDPQRAELVLLLENVSWPAALHPDLDRVKTWLCENSIQLDV